MAQNTATILNPGAITDGLPATVAVNPDEAPASAGASFAADAPAAQAGASSGPGTLRWAIERWHAAHPDFVAVWPCEIASPDGTLRARRTIYERRWATAAEKHGIPLGVYREHVQAGERWCSFHVTFHPDAEFPLSRGTTYCREGMRLYQRQRRERAS